VLPEKDIMFTYVKGRKEGKKERKKLVEMGG
jgi:hypothetical protein